MQHRQAKRAAPDAVWATELPTDLWKRCLDFAYGPATACVDPLAPLKAAATLATVSRGTQRAMADPGLWKDLARGSERCGCDKIVLAADVGGLRAARAAVARPRPRAARLFEEVHPLPRRRGADPRAVRRAPLQRLRDDPARRRVDQRGPRARRLPPRRRGSKGAAVPRHAEEISAPARAGLHGSASSDPVAGPRLLAAQRRGRARRGAARRGARFRRRAVPVAAAP